MGFTRPSTDSATPPAWQPLTFGGVAAFGGASPGRAGLVAALVALLLSGVVLRFASAIWSPAVDLAITRLPPQGAIDNGRLVWPAGQPAALVDNAFLAISVRPGSDPRADQSADLQFEFGPAALRVSSLLGYLDLAYPTGYVFPLNRAELEPLWGAWRPHLLLGIAGATFLGLMVMWALLGLVLALPLRTYALLLGRDVTLGGAWRLGLVALLPGALLVGIAVVAYSLRRLSLGEALLVSGLHVLVNLAYLAVSPWRLPAVAALSPFTASPTASPGEVPDNPFCTAAPGDPSDRASPRREADEDTPLNPS